MMRISSPVFPLLMVLVACSRPVSDANAAQAIPPAPMSSQAQVTEKVGSDGWSELAKLDTRVPVPLVPMMANHQKQNMREHLEAIQQVVEGLNHGDFTAVEKAARKMEYSEEMGAMCAHMGAGAAGFTEPQTRSRLPRTGATSQPVSKHLPRRCRPAQPVTQSIGSPSSPTQSPPRDPELLSRATRRAHARIEHTGNERPGRT